jgi:ABC-type hemin transport system substrate-binding protein
VTTNDNRPQILIRVTIGQHTFEAKRTLNMTSSLADAIVALGEEVVLVAQQIHSAIKAGKMST